ncbi:outer membrane protein assembly factor BamA [Candidatus Pelagibacter sp.]|uniref:outer membrane protein assembly factor BamA n=1 Tax=Candidatus Pelagibacter sp. TaxID=2024849 RepID=UPI003F839D73
MSFKSAFADRLNEIKLIGNERVNLETVKMFANISLGDEINDDKLNKVLKDLYETNFFSDVKINFQNSILTITLIENPVVQNLIFKGVKNKTLKKELLSGLKIKEKNPFIESNVKNDLSFLKNSLQEVGYYFSDVDIKKKQNDNNTVDLIYDISLGKKAFIKEIIFIGDKKFKKRKLLNVITSEEDKFWKFLTSKRLLNSQRIQLDKRLLLNFYKNKGYYNVKILSENVQYQDDQNFKLVFNIDSGDKYYFDNFTISLPDDYDEKYFVKSLSKLNSYSGEKYSFRVLEKMLNEIETIASTENYEFVNAKIDEKINGQKINVNIILSEPDIKTYIKKINVLGNNVTIEDVVRNELIIDEGDPFNDILFQKSLSNIKSLNIFKSVEANVTNDEDEIQKIIDINVEEKPTGEISLGAGIGTSGASTMFGIRENNFLGQGIQLDSNLTLSEETIRGQFSYTKNNYKNSDRDLTLSVQSLETDRLKNFGYKTNKTGFSIGTGFEHLEDLYIRPSFETEYESITTSSTASSLLKKQEGSYFDINGAYSLSYDKRNQSYQPSDGFISTFSQSVPFNVGDNQTLINGYEFTTYHEYLDDLVASISIFGKAANSFGDEKVRISDRLYLPSKKLRGFEAGKIGPLDGKDYVGGNYIASMNAATTLPIFESLETIDFNVFYDAANVWGVDYNSSINESNSIRSSTGVGVDWFTPIGPLSFSLAHPITKKNSDKTETFRFNLGTTF